MTTPTRIGDGRVLYFATVEGVRPTGATQHTYGQVTEGDLVPGPPMEPFAALAIVEYAHDSSGYYLLYLDAELQEVTDTWHASVAAAKDQAEFEYEGISTKWVEVAPP